MWRPSNVVFSVLHFKIVTYLSRIDIQLVASLLSCFVMGHFLMVSLHVRLPSVHVRQTVMILKCAEPCLRRQCI